MFRTLQRRAAGLHLILAAAIALGVGALAALARLPAWTCAESSSAWM